MILKSRSLGISTTTFKVLELLLVITNRITLSFKFTPSPCVSASDSVLKAG